MEKYGEQLIVMVTDYCQKNNVEPNKMLPKSLFEFFNSNEQSTQGQSSDTKYISYELYKKGKSIAEIAQQRGFVNTTIENHLAWFIGQGELDILDLLSIEKFAAIKDKLSDLNTYSLKEALGDDYSYGEIRMVIEFIKKNSAI